LVEIFQILVQYRSASPQLSFHNCNFGTFIDWCLCCLRGGLQSRVAYEEGFVFESPMVFVLVSIMSKLYVRKCNCRQKI